ncbi:glycosyltransferase family 25 protein [Psychrobacter piscatorii]|uniref:glycosyltransferase family 25 protein n=1 Tax=Psychrobacter piscatorii TaxID=554343 RepID=UPI00191ABA34|nr:glycosyltransferase family 25 protein [Psychrobacter piscatorii]
MQVYVVSLKDSIDRQNSITTQCEKLDISPVFIDAVNGKNLSNSEVSQYCNQKKAKQLFGRELLLGEIGCALSHKKIYQKIVDENIPYAVILEDDAIFDRDFSIVVKNIMAAPLSWELILLGHYKSNLKGLKSPISLWHRHRITSKFLLGRLVDFGFGTHGYMITIEGAKKLIAALDVIYKPIDHYTSNSNIINVYGLSPTVVNVDSNFDTLIDYDKVRKNTSDKSSVLILRKIGIINTMVKFKSLFKSLKPIKKYK